jgi:hypothetical protein
VSRLLLAWLAHFSIHRSKLQPLVTGPHTAYVWTSQERPSTDCLYMTVCLFLSGNTPSALHFLNTRVRQTGLRLTVSASVAHKPNKLKDKRRYNRRSWSQRDVQGSKGTAPHIPNVDCRYRSVSHSSHMMRPAFSDEKEKPCTRRESNLSCISYFKNRSLLCTCRALGCLLLVRRIHCTEIYDTNVNLTAVFSPLMSIHSYQWRVGPVSVPSVRCPTQKHRHIYFKQNQSHVSGALNGRY